MNHFNQHTLLTRPLRRLEEPIVRSAGTYRQLYALSAFGAHALVGVLLPVFVYAAIDAAAFEVDPDERPRLPRALTAIARRNTHTNLSPLYIPRPRPVS